MPKRKQQAASPKPQADEKPASLKDLLDPATVAKLKAHSEALKAEQAKEAERKRQREEEARQAERKRLENDFAYLLENSSTDWKKFK